MYIIPFTTVPLKLPLVKDDHDAMMCWCCEEHAYVTYEVFAEENAELLRQAGYWEPVNAVPPPTYLIQKSFEISVFFRPGPASTTIILEGRWLHNWLEDGGLMERRASSSFG